MTKEKDRGLVIPENLNLPEGIVAHRPLVLDLFLGTADLAANNFPRKQIEKYHAEARLRRDLYSRLKMLFAKVIDPRLDLYNANKVKLVRPGELTAVYSLLTKFITCDQNNARIILYLPGELLPDLTLEQEKTRNRKFHHAYLSAWYDLLRESDVRSSFVDGDVLEPGMPKPIRVRKAGHLLPDLLRKGFISTQEVINILSASLDEEITKSLLEGLVVARERNLISSQNWQKIYPLLPDQPVIKDKTRERITFGKSPSLTRLVESLDEKLKTIEGKYAGNVVNGQIVSAERVKWLKSLETEHCVSQTADEIVILVQNAKLSAKLFLSLVSTKSLSETRLQVILKAIFTMGKDNIAREWQPLILEIWASAPKSVRNTIITGLSRWEKLKIISKDYYQGIDLTFPDFSALLAIDLKSLVSRDLATLVRASEKIKKHPELSSAFYPILVALGSRVKGYGLNSDLDAAIFIKPEIKLIDRYRIINLLRQQIPEIATLNKMAEFWMDEQNNSLKFRLPEGDIFTVSGPAQIHFLLEGIWIGDNETVRKLTRVILGKYLDLTRFHGQKDEVRMHFLRRLEMDTIQYRLLHKGYRLFHPQTTRPSGKHESLIDGQSDFYDPGFRRIATLIFLNRVFLPDMSS